MCATPATAARFWCVILLAAVACGAAAGCDKQEGASVAAQPPAPDPPRTLPASRPAPATAPAIVLPAEPPDPFPATAAAGKRRTVVFLLGLSPAMAPHLDAAKQDIRRGIAALRPGDMYAVAIGSYVYTIGGVIKGEDTLREKEADELIEAARVRDGVPDFGMALSKSLILDPDDLYVYATGEAGDPRYVEHAIDTAKDRKRRIHTFLRHAPPNAPSAANLLRRLARETGGTAHEPATTRPERR